MLENRLMMTNTLKALKETDSSKVRPRPAPPDELDLSMNWICGVGSVEWCMCGWNAGIGWG